VYKFEQTVLINRRQQEVFDYLADLSNGPQWQSSAISAERTSEGPIGVGSTWRRTTRALGRTSDAEYECTSYDPPDEFSIKSLSGPTSTDITYSLKSTEGGTQVSITGQIEFRGLLKLMEGWVSKQADKLLVEDTNTLKHLLEEGDVGAS